MRYATTPDKPLTLLARSERFELPTLGFEVRGSSRAGFRGFSHFGDVRIFLKSGREGESAKESCPPGGYHIIGDLERATGYQGIARVRKMGKSGAPLTETVGVTERTRPRDLYDVVNLYRNADARPEQQQFVEVLREKCAFKGLGLPRLADLGPHRGAVEAGWAQAGADIATAANLGAIAQAPANALMTNRLLSGSATLGPSTTA
jgi:hypothetical protein